MPTQEVVLDLKIVTRFGIRLMSLIRIWNKRDRQGLKVWSRVAQTFGDPVNFGHISLNVQGLCPGKLGSA